MPDWQELVRQRLSDLALDAEETRQVYSDLAAPLEESYVEYCKEGLPEREALHRTLEQVADWRGLQRRICIAKRSRHPMRKPMHQLWFAEHPTQLPSHFFLVCRLLLGKKKPLFF